MDQEAEVVENGCNDEDGEKPPLSLSIGDGCNDEDSKMPSPPSSFADGGNDEDLGKPSPSWSFGEWKDMYLAEAELVEYYSNPPRPLTPLPAGATREFDEDEWDEMVSTPFAHSLYLLNFMGEESCARKEESSNRTEDGEVSKKGKKKKMPRCQTKVVLRRLPPTMTEGEFTAIMSPFPPFDYFHYCKADRSKGIHERSYAIINFISELDAHDFIERFHDCIFYDSKGNEYVSVCHLAPNQTIPKENEKPDPLAGTFKDTMSYKIFLSAFEESPETLFAVPVSEEGPITPEMMAEELDSKPKHGPESTPLLDYIRETIIKPSRQGSSGDYKESGFSKKSSMDKMRTIKKDKRKERRDRERKEKKEKDAKSKKLKPKPYGEKKYEPAAGCSKDQDSSNPSSKSESIEASTSTKSSNPSVTSTSKNLEEKRPLDTFATKESKYAKDMKPKTSPSDKKPRTFKGSELSSKVKDKTRWSKNSGLRTHYDDKYLGKVSDKKPNRSSKPPEKPRRPSLGSGKEGNDKIFTIPEADEGNSANRLKSNNSEAGKPRVATDSKSSEPGVKDTSDSGKAESSAGPSTSTGKKVIVKKIIKKVRRVKADDIDATGKSNDENSLASKKVVSVKKITSAKPKEESRPDKSGAGDTKDTAPVKNPPSDKHDSNKEVAASSSSKEKEKRVRKGRPDLQIYRPGSLRSSVTTKSGESNANGNSDTVKTDK